MSEENGLRRLPSGNWFLRKTINKKAYSFTFDHKPGKREIEEVLAEARRESEALIKGTFKQAALQFIEDRSNTLSPATINSYKSILRNLSDGFLNSKIAQISQVTIQKEINTYALNRSPKTVKNASGFITVVMWAYRPQMDIRTKLPQKVDVETYIPTDDEVRKLVKGIKGSEYEIVILLCLLGLRKSEAIAVKATDVIRNDDGYYLKIDKALVVNDDGKYREKITKTTSSKRKIWLPADLAEMILAKGYAYKGFPGNILRYLHRTQDKLGINRCKLHALRHYYVSHCQAIGIPVAVASASVGHSNISTTLNIYTHAEQDKLVSQQQKAAQILFN